LDAYERAHTPILPPDPIEAIKFRLEQKSPDTLVPTNVLSSTLNDTQTKREQTG
jgi:hypothetical protein